MTDLKVGDRIRLFRLSKKFSLVGFADTVNINKSTLSKIERNHQSPKIEYIENIAEAFDLTVDYILNYPESSAKPMVQDPAEHYGKSENLELRFTLESGDRAFIERLAALLGSQASIVSR